MNRIKEMNKRLDEREQEIEILNKGYCKFKEQCGKYATCLRENQQKEIERLNNIINELEKWLEESIEKHTDDYIDWKYDRNVYLAGSKKLQNVFDKLQELKGSDSNE